MATAIMATTDQQGNDVRGWVLCVASAVACVVGAAIICVDVPIRLLPGQENFRIQDSNVFLSCSLSLSFGVMIFSSLFSMLPSSKRYLIDDGIASQTAGFLMMGAFVLGFVGIQVVSRIIHRFMPSHVVDCDHKHGGDDDDGDCESDSEGEADGEHEDDAHNDTRCHSLHPSTRRHRCQRRSLANDARPVAVTESTPLLVSVDGPSPQYQSGGAATAAFPSPSPEHSRFSQAHPPPPPPHSLPRLRRPSMVEVRKHLLSFVKDTKTNCDEFGPCYGYSDPCGQECRRHLLAMPRPLSSFVSDRAVFPSSLSRKDSAVSVVAAAAAATATSEMPTDYQRAVILTVPEEINHDGTTDTIDATEGLDTVADGETTAGPSNASHASSLCHAGHGVPKDGENNAAEPAETVTQTINSVKDDAIVAPHNRPFHDHHSEHGYYAHDYVDGHGHGHGHGHDHDHGNTSEDDLLTSSHHHHHDLEAGLSTPHHHHVPANAFLSIGLQTVLAIGLHKFPEGFITFATNHANPALGLNVFTALFVHNIAEGFAMALPLYMALGSRLRAILWAATLGGLSQPLGAAVAALWLRYLGRGGGGGGNDTPDAPDANTHGTAYGLLFAITAGIMTAVALQLFAESLTLNHNRQLCMGFAFLGMLLLGLSNALQT